MITKANKIPENISKPALMALARFADIFSAPGFSFGEWSKSSARDDGLLEWPFYHLSDEGSAFHNAVYNLGWIRPFNWSDWMKTPKAKALFASPEGVAGASVNDLRRMLTAIFRGERFCDGTLADAFETGILTAIVQRAGVLLNETQGQS